MGDSPGRNDDELFPPQRVGELVYGRPQLPDRAPPVPSHVPPCLSQDLSHRKADLPRILDTVQKQSQLPERLLAALQVFSGLREASLGRKRWSLEIPTP